MSGSYYEAQRLRERIMFIDNKVRRTNEDQLELAILQYKLGKLIFKKEEKDD